jgi:pimeloyl-ACP methyl ester carboxylesterase
MKALIRNKCWRLGIALFVLLIGARGVGYGQTSVAPYPIIFVHGLNDSDLCFANFAETLLQMNGGTLNDMKILDFCLNHDGSNYSSILDNDVAMIGWRNGSYSAYGLYAINFDTKRPTLSDHRTATLSNQAAIYKQGKALGVMISLVLQNTQAKKVILVGHSMGGLAIREYLQRKDENGKHIWWVDPNDELDGHHIAKVVTIATPHGGSTSPKLLEQDIGVFNGLDAYSEAVRDLYPRSVYLSGGIEGDISTDVYLGYYNRDVNCNGSDNSILFNTDRDNIIGLNNFYFPKNLAYSCVIGTKSPYGADGNPFQSGDGVVSEDRANLDNFSDIDVDVFKYADPEPTSLYPLHSRIHDYFEGIMPTLDEPEKKELAYEIDKNSTNNGFITFRPNENPVDIDLYKINLDKDGTIKINITASSFSGIKAVNLIDQNDITVKPITDISQPIEYEANAGTYYLQIRGIATAASLFNLGSAYYPYTITSQFTETLIAKLTVSASSLNYYDAVIGSPKQKTVKLTNNGDANIFISKLDLTGTDAAQFARDPLLPLLITPGTSLDVNVTFNPTTVGAKAATLEITTSSPDIPVKTITLQGNGVATPTKVLAINYATSYNFGNTKINTSRSKTFIIQNTGSDPCTISQLAIEGLNPDQYTKTSPSVVPFDIGWGETKYVTVSFAPTSIGSKNAQLAIYNNSDNISPVHSIDLYGNGTENYYSGNNNTLLACEYWFDDAYDSKTKQTVTQEPENVLNVNLATTDLITGLHSLHVRYKDKKGKWSSIASEFFYKMPLLKGTTQTIAACEYWYDDDYANKVSPSAAMGQQVSLLSGNLNVTSLPQGLHAFHVRYKDSSGRWSGIASEFFYKMPVLKGSTQTIAACEYWYDDDYANKVSPSAAMGQQVSLLSGNLNVTSLPQGLHAFHVRYKDSSGRWSGIASEFFYKMPVNPSVLNLMTSYRYWFDSETTKITNEKIVTPVNPYLLLKDFDCKSLSKGNHAVHFQFRDSDGKWSSVYSETIQKDNIAPIANAGTDQTVNQNALVTLDGSASSDADNDALTYQWTAPTGIVLSSTSSATPAFTAPAVSSDTPYIFSLVVSDGTLTSTADQVVVTIKQINKAPVANAGNDQSVNEGTTVTLDGSASTDADNDALTYLWTAPMGITLSSNTAAKPTFTTPEVATDTQYTFSLIVNDGTESSTADQVIVTVKQVNKAPVANAGSDQSVNEGVTVTLDGSASSDADNDALSYHWTAPTGITLSSNTTAKPTFTAPEVTTDAQYTFSLIVNDGTASSVADQVVVTVRQVNKAPVANAGTDQTVNEGATVTLDGTASSDADNDALTYQWTTPTEITLSSNTADKPTFTAPEVTTDTQFTFSLVVNDGTASSTAYQVVVTVKQVNKAPVANAGVDQTVNEGTVVILDGSASTDPDNDVLTYLWSAPAEITLSSETAAKPSFAAPEVTIETPYTFTLIVSDGTATSTADNVVMTIVPNQVPVANAGADQTVNEGTTVTLDGSASTDADNDALTYLWTAPTGITLSSNTADKPSFTAPEVTTDTQFTFSLVVNDGTTSSNADQVVVTVKQVNKTPVANAGSDQTVNEGSTVALDGSASTDADNDALTYQWTAPTGINLSSNTADKPTFTAPEVATDTQYTFSLVVNDGTASSTADQVIITVKQVNNAPVANAGVDQSVNEGATVTLDGSASSDDDNDALFYHWTAPTEIILSSNTADKPTFTAPEVATDTQYTFSLIVNDGTESSTADQVIVTVKQVNKIPIANAGTAQTVTRETNVTLDGSLSTDPDGDKIFYKWEAPTGITLNSVTDAKPTFIALQVTTETTFTFTLSVNDGIADSDKSTVVITVKPFVTATFELDDSNLKIYPNPFNATLTVDLDNRVDFPAKISIYNLLGDFIMKEDLTETKTMLNLSNLISGSYFVKVQIGEKIHWRALIKK